MNDDVQAPVEEQTPESKKDIVALLNDAAEVFREGAQDMLKGFIFLEDVMKKQAQQCTDLAHVISNLQKMIIENGAPNAE